MSRMMLISILSLLVLNVLAFGFWIFACRPQLVVSGTVRRPGSREKSGPSVTARVAVWIRSVDARLRAIDLNSILPSRPAAVRTPSVEPPDPVDADAKQPTDLEDWIDEIEHVEDRAQVRLDGSEAWWRAWAESGGSLPSAAESCRLDTVCDDAPAVSSR